MNIRVKKEYETVVVGFNNCGLPLGQRSDLDVLARIAHQSGNQVMLNYFEEVPTPDALEAKKVDDFLKKTEK